MKDLRFKIIADFVKGGFDAAGNAVGSLKAKFAGFFDTSKIGWAKIGGAAIGAVAAIKSAGDAIRAHWFGLMDDLEQATIDFDRKNAQIFRKIRFMNTETDKARLKESIENEIRDVRAARDKLVREEETQSPLEKAKDFVEKKINARMGFGELTDNELKIKRLDESLRSLGKSLEIVKNTRVDTFFDDVSAKISEISDAEFLRETGENSPANLVRELERRVAESKDAMDKAVAALDPTGAQRANVQAIKTAEDELATYLAMLEEARNAPPMSLGYEFDITGLEEKIGKAKSRIEELKSKTFESSATEIDRDKAVKATETWKRYTEELRDALKVLKDLNEESVTPPPEAPPTPKREKPKRKGYQMPQSERDRERKGKYSRYRDEEDSGDPYAMDLAPSMTESNVGMTKMLRGARGLSGRRGKRITSFSTPAHMAEAIKNRSAGLGEKDANSDPLLIAMKEAQATRTRANELLERIEKKTGAAP